MQDAFEKVLKWVDSKNIPSNGVQRQKLVVPVTRKWQLKRQLDIPLKDQGSENGKLRKMGLRKFGLQIANRM